MYYICIVYIDNLYFFCIILFVHIWKVQKGKRSMKKSKRTLSDKGFEKMFRSMQYLNFTVLYYDFDFNKEQIKAFNAHNKDFNSNCLDCTAQFYAEEHRILKEYGFDCEKVVTELPFRAKLKILGVQPKTRNLNQLLQGCNEAIEICLVMFLHEFTTTWNKKADDVRFYWKKFKENSMNYANGMTDSFVVQYFKDELDLAITE